MQGLLSVCSCGDLINYNLELHTMLAQYELQ